MPTDIAIIQRIDALTASVSHLLRLRGVRLTRAEVCRRIGVGRNTLHARIRADEYPRPMLDGKWLLADVLEWEVRPPSPARAPARKPPSPGDHHLYRHFDGAGRLLYVGVSLSALKRLCDHRKKSAWFSQIARIEVEGLPTRAAALAAERRAIRAERPLHNVVHARKP